MFVVSFKNLKSRALSLDPSGDPVMPRAKGGNINVFIHLKYYTLIRQQEIKYRHNINKHRPSVTSLIKNCTDLSQFVF